MISTFCKKGWNLQGTPTNKFGWDCRMSLYRSPSFPFVQSRNTPTSMVFLAACFRNSCSFQPLMDGAQLRLEENKWQMVNEFLAYHIICLKKRNTNQWIVTRSCCFASWWLRPPVSSAFCFCSLSWMVSPWQHQTNNQHPPKKIPKKKVQNKRKSWKVLILIQFCKKKKSRCFFLKEIGPQKNASKHVRPSQQQCPANAVVAQRPGFWWRNWWLALRSQPKVQCTSEV